eukprot:sb/3472745/
MLLITPPTHLEAGNIGLKKISLFVTYSNLHFNPYFQEPTETSKQPIRTRYLGHVTGYQPIRDQYFLIRSTTLQCIVLILHSIHTHDLPVHSFTYTLLVGIEDTSHFSRAGTSRWPKVSLSVVSVGTDTSEQPIRTPYLGHVTGYQPIGDHYFLIRSVPGFR